MIAERRHVDFWLRRMQLSFESFGFCSRLPIGDPMDRVIQRYKCENYLECLAVLVPFWISNTYISVQLVYNTCGRWEWYPRLTNAALGINQSAAQGDYSDHDVTLSRQSHHFRARFLIVPLSRQDRKFI